jgi:MFS family permease
VLVRSGCTLVATAIALVALTTWSAVPAWVAAIAWTVGGTGMGLAMASVAVLTLQLSPSRDQGANSAALQVSDSLFSAVTIGVGGAIYALGLRHGSGSWALRVIDVLMVGIAVLGVVVAGRVRPQRAPDAVAPSTARRIRA